MAISNERRRSFVAKQVGSLVLAQVDVDNPMAMVRAASWYNALERLGVHLPLFVVHDIGLLMTNLPGPAGWDLRPRRALLARVGVPDAVQPLIARYREMLVNISSSEVIRKLAGWRIRDELVAVLLVRALLDVYNRWQDRGKTRGTSELPLELGVYADADVGQHFLDFDAEPLWQFLEHLVSHSLHVYTRVELIDLDTIRLLGIFRAEGEGQSDFGGGIDLVDLFSSLGSPEAGDIANFSLDLLPSVLETKRAAGAQMFSVDGYTSLERKGNIDSLVLSELAYDREVFEQKIVDRELLYYGHERQREDERRLQYILVDSSASMRGRRQVFGRGLAITLAKKLSLRGEEVWLRFFDSRLHDLVKLQTGSPFPVPHILSFRSERGRNYSKVFRQFALELSRLRRDQGRQIVTYIITHGQCHIPPDLVAALSQQSYLYGIIILPSSDVSPDFLPLLHRHQIVSSTALSSRVGRKERALSIVADATEEAAVLDVGIPAEVGGADGA